MQLKHLLNAMPALQKLYNYSGLSSTQFFFLVRMSGPIDECVAAYSAARGRALAAHGQSTDGGATYAFESPSEEQAFLDEEKALLGQDIDLAFPADMFCLDFNVIDAVDAALPPNKRHGLTASDIKALWGVVPMIEPGKGGGEKDGGKGN